MNLTRKSTLYVSQPTVIATQNLIKSLTISASALEAKLT